MFNEFSKELHKRLQSIERGLLKDCDEHELSNNLNKSQIKAIDELKKFTAKVYRMENPTSILEAARKKDFTILAKLLEETKSCKTDKTGKSTKLGKSRISIKNNRSYDINAQDRCGYTALHLAVELHENPAMVAMLLNAGADHSIRCNDGWTPLEYAVDYELFDIEELLEGYGATAD